MIGKTRIGLLIASLLCITGLSAACITTALGDVTTNPDGSHTVTAAFPNPPGFPCPTSFNGTTSTSMSAFVPSGARIVSHRLIFNPPCPGSAVTETFNPNASDPPPAPDDQTARDDFTVTCQQMGGCAGGHVSVTLEVTYFDPVAPPLPQDVVIPKTAKVDPKSGKGELRIRSDSEIADELDRISMDALRRPCWRHYRPWRISPPEGTTGWLHFKLNERCLMTLDRKGTLRVVFDATLRNSAGHVPFTRKLKLVKKR